MSNTNRVNGPPLSQQQAKTSLGASSGTVESAPERTVLPDNAVALMSLRIVAREPISLITNL